jgi:hypothetical protein
VQPATVVGWHRRAFSLYWRWRSRRPGVGRPAVARDIRVLIRQMRSANPLWGAPRIHGELRKLGIEVSQTTVAKYVGRRRTPPSPTWRTFLTTHPAQSASIDFFTVPTATLGVVVGAIVKTILDRAGSGLRSRTSPVTGHAVQEANEIRIFRPHDGLRVSGRPEDRRVGGVAELEITNGQRGHTQRPPEPRREGWGKLRVDPEGHAATIG